MTQGGKNLNLKCVMCEGFYFEKPLLEEVPSAGGSPLSRVWYQTL